MLPSQEEKKAQEASSKLPKTSNDWRYVETDSEAEEDTEREPEVDLTGFNARVAAIDLNSQTQAQAPESDSDEDEEAWQEQARQKELAQVDWEEMKREKESAEAARELKERFERQPQGLAGAAQWRRAVNRPPAARAPPRAAQGLWRAARRPRPMLPRPCGRLGYVSGQGACEESRRCYSVNRDGGRSRAWCVCAWAEADGSRDYL